MGLQGDPEIAPLRREHDQHRSWFSTRRRHRAGGTSELRERYVLPTSVMGAPLRVFFSGGGAPCSRGADRLSTGVRGL